MRINWLELWDKLNEELQKKNSWGKNELLDLMNKIEKDAIRKLEEACHDPKT